MPLFLKSVIVGRLDSLEPMVAIEGARVVG